MYTEEKYSITDLSKILKVTDHTLRYYEKEFDLLVPRDSRGRRYYTKDLINVFKNIKNQRNKGIEIRLIKKTLPETFSDYIYSLNISNDKTLDPPLNGANEYYTSFQENIDDIKLTLEKIDENVCNSIISEINSSTVQIISIINENMENLSSSLESNTKLLDYRLEKHFSKVDNSLTEWRNRNKGGIFKQFLQKLYVLIAKT